MPIALQLEQDDGYPQQRPHAAGPEHQEHAQDSSQNLHVSLHVADRDDLIAARTAGGGHIDDIALGFADERAGDG